MKTKSFISLLCLTLGMFLFQACNDVPSPYDIPGKGVANSIYGTGTKDSPYTVKGASLNQNGGYAWVKAYIVGYIPVSTGDGGPSYTISDVVFGADGAGAPNIVIASSPDSKNINDCMAVQLPSGDVRNALNLQAHPENLGKEVLLYGTMEKYFGGSGVKSVTAAILDGQEIGDMPEESGEAIFSADFSQSLGEFASVSTSGSLEWYNDYSSAMITGYKDFNGDGEKENQAGVTFLVGPEIDLSQIEEAYVATNMAINYERGDLNANNSILISKNYSGDANSATWTQLTYDTEGLNSDFTFKNKKTAIPAEFMGGKVYIALRHTCSDTQSSTWEVKKIEVIKGKIEDTPEEPNPEGEYLNQDFTSSLGGFTSTSVSGTLEWYNDFQSAMITGYQDFNGDGQKENQAGETYFVSPAFTIGSTSAVHMAINMAINYERGDLNANNSILISKDYTGNVNSATWTQLTYDTDGLNADFTFKNKEINIPSEFIGSNVVVALRHTCTDTQSSTWEVKSIKVLSGNAEEPGTDPEPTPGGEGDALIAIDGATVSLTAPEATASGNVTTTDLNSFGWENAGDPLGATDSEGTEIIFAQEEGNNPPKFYTATGGVRMYALNSMTLKASKPIAKVVLNCDSYQGTNYVGNTQLYATIDGNNWKIVNDHTSSSGGVQLRIKTIEITYAE